MDFKSAVESKLFKQILATEREGILLSELGPLSEVRRTDLEHLLFCQLVEFDRTIDSVVPSTLRNRWNYSFLSPESMKMPLPPMTAKLRCSDIGLMMLRTLHSQTADERADHADLLRMTLGVVLEVEWMLHIRLDQVWNGEDPRYLLVRQLAAVWSTFVGSVREDSLALAARNAASLPPSTRKNLLRLNGALMTLEQSNLVNPSDLALSAIRWIAQLQQEWPLRIVIRVRVSTSQELGEGTKPRRWTKTSANAWLNELIKQHGHVKPSSVDIKRITKETQGPAWGTIQKPAFGNNTEMNGRRTAMCSQRVANGCRCRRRNRSSLPSTAPQMNCVSCRLMNWLGTKRQMKDRIRDSLGVVIRPRDRRMTVHHWVSCRQHRGLVTVI